MTEQNLTQAINLILSRDEVLVALDALSAATIPGLDPDPLGDMSTGQRRLASLVAGRSLRARGLAKIRDDGQLLLHRTLLSAVGTCAYSQSALMVLHWTAASEAPVRIFGHQRSAEVVEHIPHDDVLHEFLCLPGRAQLIDEILTRCQCQDIPSREPLTMTIARTGFAQARSLAGSGDPDGATAYLVAAQAPERVARAFARTWAQRPRVSLIQMLQHQTGSVWRRDITLVQDDQRAWLAVPVRGDADSPMSVNSVSRAEVARLLNEWL